jgi:transcriptional regulator with XRE-family HTH domain
MESFSDWLLKELKNRNISQSDLARIAGLGSGTISNIMSGNRKVGQDTLNKIANGLRLPPELVYEKAGLLPPKNELSEIKRTLIHLAKDLPDSDVELAVKILETRANYYRQNPEAKPDK